MSFTKGLHETTNRFAFLIVYKYAFYCLPCSIQKRGDDRGLRLIGGEEVFYVLIINRIDVSMSSLLM